MRTPKKWSENIKKGIITDEMLESALFSVNKRAKNYRDKKREYSHYRYARYNYSEQAEEKMNEMYDKKDKLLSLIPPVCIHVEYQNSHDTKRVEIGNSVEPYLRYIYSGEITHFGSYVRRNRHGGWYDDWYDDYDTEYVCFFDHAKQPFQKAYYLFRVLGDHSFHSPIDKSDLENYKGLPVISIDSLITHGESVLELCSMQFVDKIIALIDSGSYTYTHTDHADQDYIRSAESCDKEQLVRCKKVENTTDAVAYFSEMIADAMEIYAENELHQKARRKHPNSQEMARWDKKAEKEYEKNMRLIRKCNEGSGKKARKRATDALDRLEKGRISVSVETGVKAYKDEGRLIRFIYSTADLYSGRSDVTLKELVEACPPDTSPDAVLKDPERTANNYIRHKYMEIIADNAAEIEKMKEKLAEQKEQKSE